MEPNSECMKVGYMFGFEKVGMGELDKDSN